MRILLLGKDGQVGWELQRSLACLGEVVALGSAAHAGAGVDLAQPDALVKTVREVRPAVIVNAAAYTAVDRAESEPDLAWRINAEAPSVLAQEARKLDAWLVHYGTDYVFDGSGHQPRDEQAPTDPLSAYGRTKLGGETAVRASGCRHLIFRTSWVHGARGRNFARTMLQLARERERITVVGDQIGAPTGADLIADVTAHALHRAIADPSAGGLYHLAAAGETSWHGYACFVIESARALGMPLRLAADGIDPITTAQFAAPARRPATSRLSTDKLCARFNLVMPPWQAGVERLLREMSID